MNTPKLLILLKKDLKLEKVQIRWIQQLKRLRNEKTSYLKLILIILITFLYDFLNIISGAKSKVNSIL